MPQNISKGRSWLIILALLSLNIVEQAASVITGTIPGMKASFPNVSQVNIELVTTVVSVFVTIFVLLSGLVVKQIGQKNTAILGLLIASVASIVPAVATNFTLILVSRAILGIGIGLANPLAISMIGVFFYGDQRARLMGWRSAIAGIGTAIMTYVAGQLLAINWHAAYWVYLLFVPTLLLFIFFVPDPVKSGAVARQEAEQAKEKAAAAKQGVEVKQNSIPLIAALTVLIFITLTMFMVLAVKLPVYFVENNIGTATQASTCWSLVNIATVLGGFLFGPAYKWLKDYVLPVSLVLGGVGIIAIAAASSVGAIYAIGMVTGVASSLGIPYIFTKISESSTPSKAPLFTSIALVGSNLGSFISPYAGAMLGTSAQMAIKNAGITETVVAVIVFAALLMIRASHHKHQNTVTPSHS